LLFTGTSTNGFPPPPPPSKSGLKLCKNDLRVSGCHSPLHLHFLKWQPIWLMFSHSWASSTCIRMVTNQASYPSTLSSSMKVRTVQVVETSLCFVTWHVASPGHLFRWLIGLQSSTPSTAWATHPSVTSQAVCISTCFVWKVLGKDVPEAPVWKGPQAAISSTPHHPSSRTQILPCTRGPLLASSEGHVYDRTC
jgi:hypothetical protein